MSNESAQRVDYGSKTGEIGHDKEISNKPLEMTKAGGPTGQKCGPTGSSRSYPKGSSVSLKPDFNPQKKSDRSGTDWAVGGV